MAESKWTFAQKFYTDFHAKTAELASHLDALKRSSAAAPDVLQAVAVDVSQLAKSLAEATGSLPSYDQRQCEIQLKSLERVLEELRGTSSAAPKFSFKRKSAKSKAPAELSSGNAPTPRDTLPDVGSASGFSSLSFRYLTISDLASRSSSGEISLSDISNCIMNMLPHDKTHISAIHLQRVTNCILLLPHISGSVLLHDMSNCVLVVGCHQFRMHNSTEVDVYLSVGTNPVIEHCSNIRFAKFPDALSQDPAQQVPAVQDFSHIRASPSPNWSILSEGKKKHDWPISPLQGEALIAELRAVLPGDRDRESILQDR
ncbi:tubulin binding cofactor C-domain-containing protein [Scleroderma yunnanense]